LRFGCPFPVPFSRLIRQFDLSRFLRSNRTRCHNSSFQSRENKWFEFPQRQTRKYRSALRRADAVFIMELLSFATQLKRKSALQLDAIGLLSENIKSKFAVMPKDKYPSTTDRFRNTILGKILPDRQMLPSTAYGQVGEFVFHVKILTR
jgi:hypothetical protein